MAEAITAPIIRHWREVGGNAVVFDIKDSDGSVTVPFRAPAARQSTTIYLHDVPNSSASCTSRTCTPSPASPFSATSAWWSQHPELAVQSRKNKTAWRENGKLVWTDPSQPQVQDYNIALAKHVAQLGADEIQFDYVRFPAEGDQKDAAFVYQNGQQTSQKRSTPKRQMRTAASPVPRQWSLRPGDRSSTRGRAPLTQRRTHTSQVAVRRSRQAAPRGPQRTDVITAFLKKAYAELHPTGVSCSAWTSSASWPGSARSTSPTPDRTSSAWPTTATCSAP